MTHFVARSGACKMLLALPCAAWPAQALADLLTVAVAAGDKQLVSSLLEQQRVKWQVQQLVQAIQAALLTDRWELLPLLQAGYKGGAWTAADFLPALHSICRCGHVEGLKQLQLLLDKACVKWSTSEKQAALGVAAGPGRAAFVSFQLSGPFRDAGLAGGGRAALTAAAGVGM